MTHRRTHFAIAVFCWFVGTLPTATASPLAEQVVATRIALDELAEQLESHRRTARERASALRTERSELRRQVRLEKIRQDTLKQLRLERTKRIDDQEGRFLTFS